MKYNISVIKQDIHFYYKKYMKATVRNLNLDEWRDTLRLMTRYEEPKKQSLWDKIRDFLTK